MINHTIPIISKIKRITAKLVQKHTKVGKIKSKLDIYEINEGTMKKLEKDKSSETEKVFNLLRSIEKVVSEQFKNNPYLISIGERAENISLRFRQRQLDTKDTLEDLKDLIEDINTAKKERIKKKMSSDVFSVYWLLKNQGIKKSEEIAKQMEKPFKTYPHWKKSEEQERKIKQELYKIFIKEKLGAKKATEIGKKIISDLRESAK